MQISYLVFGWSQTRLNLRECVTLSLIAENPPIKPPELSTISGVVLGTVRNSIQILNSEKLIFRTRNGYRLTNLGKDLFGKWQEGKTLHFFRLKN